MWSVLTHVVGCWPMWSVLIHVVSVDPCGGVLTHVVSVDPCGDCVAEKVRQIQDKLEEFIQALNKEKWSPHCAVHLLVHCRGSPAGAQWPLASVSHRTGPGAEQLSLWRQIAIRIITELAHHWPVLRVPGPVLLCQVPRPVLVCWVPGPILVCWVSGPVLVCRVPGPVLVCLVLDQTDFCIVNGPVLVHSEVYFSGTDLDYLMGWCWSELITCGRSWPDS